MSKLHTLILPLRSKDSGITPSHDLTVGDLVRVVRPDDRHLNVEAVDAMTAAGFTVGDYDIVNLPTAYNQMAEAEAIYINGGNPGTLRYLAAACGLDRKLVEWNQAGKVLIGASAGGILLASGRLWLTCLWAVKPHHLRVPWAVPHGIGLHGLSIIDSGFIPHNAESRFPSYVRKLAMRTMGVNSLIFVDDGKFAVIDT